MRGPIKGSFVHNAPSFYLRNMAACQNDTGPLGVGQIGAIGLFNNTNTSDWLVVWDIEINLFNAGSKLDIVDGTLGPGFTNSLGLPHPGAPIVSGMPLPTGFSFADSPLTETGLLFFSSFIPTGGYHWPHEWPVCAIQPGYSCTFFTAANAYQDYGLSFVYEVVKGGI